MFLLRKVFDLRDQVSGDAEKPFLEHLEDLRIVITRIVLTVLVSTIVCFVFKDQLMEFIRRPIDKVWENKMVQELNGTFTVNEWSAAKENSYAAAGLTPEQQEVFFRFLGGEKAREDVRLLLIYRSVLQVPEKARGDYLAELPGLDETQKPAIEKLLIAAPSAALGAGNNIKLMGSFKPTEAFMLSIKLAFFAGLVIAFPLLLYFILSFILPGLKENEKKALWPALVIGFGLFLAGVSFSYFIVLEGTLEFFYDYGQSMEIENDWRIGYYISFATTFTLVFGLAFELPVVVMTFVKIGLLSYDVMRETRRYAIVAIWIIAAFITPTPDILTLSLLAVPMCVLYEICIWLALWMQRKEEEREQKEDEERLARLMAAPHLSEHAEEEEDESWHPGMDEEGEEGDTGVIPDEDEDLPYEPRDKKDGE